MGHESFCAFCPFVQNTLCVLFTFFVANAPFPSAASRLCVRDSRIAFWRDYLPEQEKGLSFCIQM